MRIWLINEGFTSNQPIVTNRKKIPVDEEVKQKEIQKVEEGVSGVMFMRYYNGKMTGSGKISNALKILGRFTQCTKKQFKHHGGTDDGWEALKRFSDRFLRKIEGKFTAWAIRDQYAKYLEPQRQPEAKPIPMKKMPLQHQPRDYEETPRLRKRLERYGGLNAMMDEITNAPRPPPKRVADEHYEAVMADPKDSGFRRHINTAYKAHRDNRPA